MTAKEATELVESLYDTWGPFLVRHAFHLTGDRAIAEDLAQEAFMAIYRALRSGEDIANPRAWTLAVVRNQAVNRARSERRRPQRLESNETLDLMAGPNLFPESVESRDVSLWLGLLSKRELEVLLLRIESRKYREIADELGISAKSVATLLARALHKLQAAAKEAAAQSNPVRPRKNVS